MLLWMNIDVLLFIIYFRLISSVLCDKSCSREGSRIVREYFTQAFAGLCEKNHISIPSECIFSPKRDIFYEHELNKIKLSKDKWLCQYCNKVFSTEHNIDLHLSHRHNDTLIQNEHSVCLSDYCPIFRCDILKRPKKSLRSFNLLTRIFDISAMKTSKKTPHEQQLMLYRNRCASIINQCIPHNINYDTRVNMQHEMYAEVCSYLTTNRHHELPNYRKSLINFTYIFCLTILLGLCFILISIVKHSNWRFNRDDDDESDKHLSEETILTATALLAKSPRNSIIHATKNPSTSTIRHRVRFKPLDECQSSSYSEQD